MVTQHRLYSRRQVVLTGLATLGGLSAGVPTGRRQPRLLAAPHLPDAGARGAVDGRIVAATNAFGFRLHAQLATHDPQRNVFIAPSSVAIALAMTYNGARGSTQRAMATTLGLQGMTLDEVNRAHRALRVALTHPDPHVQLAVADGLWERKGLTFNRDFGQRNETFYGASVAALDFGDPRAPAIINGWVSSATHGKIRTLVDRIDPRTLLYLTNAIYFKGRWRVPFDRALTHERTFMVVDGHKIALPMMSQRGRYLYYRGPSVQAVSLPYGTGKVSMYVFLPDPGSSLFALQARLNAGNWTTWLPRFQDMPGTIVLPRFTLDYGARLVPALAALGMAVAFDRMHANFAGMITDRPASISDVVHRTAVEVNEEGTTAAAATGVAIGTTAIESGFTMVVDRPFFCAIGDHATGAILFMGSIVDPA